MPSGHRRGLAVFANRVPAGGLALLAFAVIIIGVVWAFTVQRVRGESAEATASELTKNANLALALDVQTNQLIKGLDRLLLLLKSEHERPEPRLPLDRLIAPGLSDVSSLPFIGVMDERGDVVEALQPFNPTNLSDRDMFHHHQRLDTNALLISRPALGRVSGRWTIALTRRINKLDGSFGGVVGISIEPRYLTELFENTALGAGDIMSLVLDTGITLARRSGTRISFGEDVSQAQIFSERAKADIGGYIGPGGIDGRLRIFSYRSMRDYPIVVAVGTAEDDALASVRGRAATYYGSAIAATVFVAVMCGVGVALLGAQRRTNQQVRDQASLLDKAQDAIVVVDLDRRLTYWNKSAERLFGWTAEEAIGRRVPELFAKNAVSAALADAYEQVVRTGEWTGTLNPIGKNGQTVATESRWTLVHDGEGRAARILTINTDVTERQRLEQQFLRAQRLESIGTMAGGIAHDLNNVLTPITLAIELLGQRSSDPNSRDLIATISSSAIRGADLVRQVLLFARGQEGQRIEVDPAELLADVTRIVGDTLPKNIEFRTAVAPDVPGVTGDPTQLQQVLLNLCVNARDAMPDGGHLTMAASGAAVDAQEAAVHMDAHAGVFLVLEVRDTGSGIAPEHLDRIFDPFFTTKELGKGTGLGLSTSLTIVRGHAGHIRVDSEPGRGTRFRVYLPASAAAAAPMRFDDAVEPSRADGQTVLIVDDEVAVRSVARRALERYGYHVLQATDGADATKVYTAYHGTIAVVVMDMTMPGIDGASAIRSLVALDPRVRIVAVSGLSANEQVARSAGPQVRAFLQKPFTAVALVTTVQRAAAPTTTFAAS